MNYPSIEIVRKALVDIGVRYNIPEFPVSYWDFQRLENCLKSNTIEFQPRGQFAAIVRKAHATAQVHEVSNVLFQLEIKFYYEHADGSNGYTSRFLIVCSESFGEIEYVGVVEYDVYWGIKSDLLNRINKKNYE